MIQGVGTDVVEIARVAMAIERTGERFLRRILAPAELDLAQRQNQGREAEFVAGRFAAKEAMAKALGCGLGRLHMACVDIKVTKNGLDVEFLPGSFAVEPFLRWHLSISHSATVAFAIAICERI
jgi:holo-[acyl-carrier protein] synthase